jgi:exosortase/archaeosortase family protein
MSLLSRIRGWETLPSSFRQVLVLGMVLVALLIFDQQASWRQREDYYFGFLVPVFVYLVLEERWKSILGVFHKEGEDNEIRDMGHGYTERPWFTAGVLLMIVAGVFSLLIGGGVRAAEGGTSAPASLALNVGYILSFPALMLLSVRGGTLQKYGYQPLSDREKLRLLGYFGFPILIWLLSAPMVAALESKISIFLLNQVTKVVFHTFNFLGFVIEQQGNTLNLPKGSVGVAEACSGIRSLMACLFAGSVMGALYLDKLWKKILMVGMAMVFAFLMNLLRSLFLTGWAYNYGSEAIEGTVHDVTGYAVLGLTCIGLFILLPLFNFKIPEIPEDELEDGSQDE